jgi:Kef-type K+ transport system membrane component KefB
MAVFFVESFQLYSLLIILVGVLLFSLVERRFGIPPLIGAVFIGIILGPSVVNFIQYDAIPEWLSFLSLMGGMLILFLIGLESDLRELISNARNASVIMSLGMFFPAIFVFILSMLFGFGRSQLLLLIAAAVVTATPISMAIILAMKKEHTAMAHYLHAATILDNIVGVFFIFFLIAVHETGAVKYDELAKIIFVLLFLLAISYTIMPKISRWLFNALGRPGPQARITIAFSFVLFFGAVSSQFLYEAAFGAFLAGVVLSEIKADYKKELMKTITDIGEGFFFPLFFLTIGLGVNLGSVIGSWLIISFLVLYIIIAVLGKYAGGYLGALVTGHSKTEARAIGAGLIPRGGMGLIVAQVGLGLAVLTQTQFSTIVLMTFVTTVVGVWAVYKTFSKLRSNAKHV